MKRFDLAKLVSLFGSFHQVQATCGYIADTGRPAEGDYSWFIRICDEAAKLLNCAGFNHSSRKAFVLKCRFETRQTLMSPSVIQAEFRCLEDSVLIDMGKHRFAQIDSKLARFAQAKDLLGEKVSECFPSAAVDISDAGDCIALGCDTAAVFHLMHVVEWGLRAFAAHLKLLKVSVGKKANKWVPLAYAQWEQILNQLPHKIEQKTGSLPRGPKK